MKGKASAGAWPAWVLVMISLCPCASGGEEGQVFHFDFKGAQGKTEIADLSGTVRCQCQRVPMLVEHGALRVATEAHISIPPQPGIPEMTKQLTVSAWILKVGNDVAPILLKGGPGQPAHFLFGVQGAYSTFCYGSPPKGLCVVGSAYGGDFAYANPDWVLTGAEPRIRIGTWQHVAATFDQGWVTVYINARPTAQVKARAELLPNTLPFYIGAERVEGRDSNYRTADMLLNDLRLYSTALSARQVADIYQEEKGGYPSEPIGLKKSYHYLGFGAEFDPDFQRTLPITRAYLAHLPHDDVAGRPPCSAIRPYHGALTIFAHDKAQTPLLFHPRPPQADPESRHKFCCAMEDFAATGIEVVTTSAMYVSEFWQGPDQYDFQRVDQVCHDILKANPRAKILAALYLAAPAWWYRQHPEQKEQYYMGSSGEGGLRTWEGHAPMSSDLWLNESLAMLRQYVKHIESSDYADHVIGYIPGGGGAEEWHWIGCFNGLTGYSPVTRKNFQEWLRKRYGDEVGALRRAWRDEAVTFDSATVPPPELRLQSEHLEFRDPRTAAQVFDFRRYMSDRVAQIITTTCRTLKEASTGGRLVGIYNGYPLHFAGSGTLANTGHLAYASTCKSEWIDCFFNMPSYAYEYRGGGGTGLMANGFTGTARLYNKLLICENDLRTHLYEEDQGGRTRDLAETLAVIERNAGIALTTNTAQWWYNLVGYHVFHQQEMIQRIAELNGAAHRALEKDRASAAEVALVCDLESMYYSRYQGSPFRQALYYGAYNEAGRMGAPFEMYLAEDLKDPRMPDYKLYVFMNQFHADKDTGAAIARKIRRNNAVAVWCYAPGYISPDGFSAETMRDLTGMQTTASTSEQKLQMTSTAEASPITQYFTGSKPYMLGPVFKVDDPAAEVLASTEFGPALAVRQFQDWRSVYCLMPLDHALLTGLCEYAGAHVYCKSGDVFTANSGYLMLHTTTAGAKTIVLPKPCTVRDAVSGDLVGEGISSFTQALPEKVTRIYELTPRKPDR